MRDRAPVRYRAAVFDSSRWEGFELRPDDIIISTPPKSGTTWTQMICALLVFQQPELEQPLSAVSPWLDALFRSRTEVVAGLGAQQHRRFIKTHTPLDGLPLHPSVTYLVVGRDTRDVAMSMDNHMGNLDMDRAMSAFAHGAEIDGIRLGPFAAPPQRPESARERFWRWVDDDSSPESGATGSLVKTMHHLGSFWTARLEANIVMLHYDDLKRDLEGEMRRLAAILGIRVPEDRWPELVAAASFEAMREHADQLAPNTAESIWRDNQRFFNRGASGQWRELLTVEDLERYWRRVEQLAPADLVEWLHRA